MIGQRDHRSTIAGLLRKSSSSSYSLFYCKFWFPFLNHLPSKKGEINAILRLIFWLIAKIAFSTKLILKLSNNNRTFEFGEELCMQLASATYVIFGYDQFISRYNMIVHFKTYWRNNKRIRRIFTLYANQKHWFKRNNSNQIIIWLSYRKPK